MLTCGRFFRNALASFRHFLWRPLSLERVRGGCGMFIAGQDDSDWAAPFLSREALGYVENENGFTCGRCSEFEPAMAGCRKVEGEIVAGACCNAWERAYRRGRMNDDVLAAELKPELERAERKRTMRVSPKAAQ